MSAIDGFRAVVGNEGNYGHGPFEWSWHGASELLCEIDELFAERDELRALGEAMADMMAMEALHPPHELSTEHPLRRWRERFPAERSAS